LTHRLAANVQRVRMHGCHQDGLKTAAYPVAEGSAPPPAGCGAAQAPKWPRSRRPRPRQAEQMPLPLRTGRE
jgi:hypothetical protein